MALLILGFALKMGLAPVHVWLPLAHPAAPMPASAVLSGVVVKAGVIGLIRFLPLGSAMPEWGIVLIVIGFVTAFAGVLIGITQKQPKTVLAHSTVSQMGLVAVIFGAGLGEGSSATADVAAFYALHHMLVKGSLFMAVGVLAATGPSRFWSVLLITGCMALSLAGPPLTGGMVAKLAMKSLLGDGTAKTLATLASVGSTILVLHFLVVLARSRASHDATNGPDLGLSVPWLATSAMAVILPWALFAPVTGQSMWIAIQCGCSSRIHMAGRSGPGRSSGRFACSKAVCPASPKATSSNWHASARLPYSASATGPCGSTAC